MNKNALILSLMFSCSLAAAEEAEKSQNFNSYLSGSKKIQYQISIKKGEEIFFKSLIWIKNENQVVLLASQNSRSEKKITKKNGGVNEEQVITSQDLIDTQIKDASQLLLTIHLDKNGKNMWSEFDTKDFDASQEEKTSALGKEQTTAVMTESTPLYKKANGRFLVMHTQNQETIFFWDDKLFTIKANYK